MKFLLLLILLSPLGGWSDSMAQNFSITLEEGFVVLENGADIKAVIAPDKGGELSGLRVFSIGNHITFNAPLIQGSEAAQVQFENDFPDHLITGTDKAFAGEIIPSVFHGRHRLDTLPKRKSVSLAGQQGVAELTIYDLSGLHLRLRHHSSAEAAQPAIQFNLWADTDAGFFSPEPWVGTQNSLNTGMGLISLQPGQSWQWQIDIVPELGTRSEAIKSKEM